MNEILQGDCLEVLKGLPDGIVDCCVTSPPYYGLRDYGTGKWVGGDPKCPHRRLSKRSDKTKTGHKQRALEGNVGDAIYKSVCPLCGAVREDKQIGLEETPEQFIQRLVDVFREVRRVLKDDGTLWVNIGDSYAAQRGGTYQPAETLAGGKHGKTADGENVNRGRKDGYNPTRNAAAIGMKHKDLIGIPWMLAFALRSDGWYLRKDIIWHKPNPMPESVKDRCTKSHEYIFLLSKSERYYFDSEAIQEIAKGIDSDTGTRNKRDVWTVSVASYHEAHFATFPEELIEPCILAGSRPGGIVLDPFFGSGTTGAVSEQNNRKYLGIELNPEYIKIAERRLESVQPKLMGIV